MKFLDISLVYLQIEDKNRELDIQSSRLDELEKKLEKQRTDNSDLEKKLRKEIDNLLSKNSEIETKLVDSGSVVSCLFNFCLYFNLHLYN